MKKRIICTFIVSCILTLLLSMNIAKAVAVDNIINIPNYNTILEKSNKITNTNVYKDKNELINNINKSTKSDFDANRIIEDLRNTNAKASATVTIPHVDEKLKVYDYADLFTDEEEHMLYKKIIEYIEKYNYDMVIVTIDNNPTGSSQTYAEKFYDINQFGIGDNRNGILFLIDMHKRNIWITTTGDAIGTYKSHIDSMLDNYCYDYVKAAKYYECADAFVKSACYSYDKNVRNTWIVRILVVVGSSLVIPTAFCLIMKSKHKQVRFANDANNYISNINILNSRDIFLRSSISRVAKSSSSSSGSSGGGGGGGHGGGGRSF